MGEIRTGSSSENRVPRCTFSSRVCSNRSVTRQDSIVSECFDKAAGSQACHSSTVALHSRSDGIHGQSLTPGEGFQETSSVGTQREMVSKAGFMGRQDSVRFLVCQGDQSLDRQGVSNIYVSSSSSCPRAAVVYGCESKGLGRSYGIADGIRILAPRQTWWGVTLVHTVQSSGRDCIMVCQEQNTHQSETLARKTQCFGRLNVQEREHCSDRMVTESASDKSAISHLEFSSSGSICYSPEQEITAVRVTCSGPGSICNRRPESELDGHVGVCLSSLSSHSLMSEKDSEQGMHSLSDSTILGVTGVVSSSNVIGHSSSTSTPSKEGSIVPTCIQNVASRPPGVRASRLVAMQQQMQASGISESVARRIYSSKRPSTNNLFDYRWKSWLDWCLSREVDPFSPSVNRFWEFLISLHERNFSPNTVKGYRSAISTTLKQISKVDFSNQSILSDVVRSFELERPRSNSHFPKWDLALVLSTLSGELFEPLPSCGFKELTFKTVFLTALATGRRRSKIHVFSSADVQFSDESVILCTFPGFLAKN